MIGGHRDIGLAPPDGIARFIVLDDELVLGAAPGVLAGFDDERAILGEQAFAMAKRILNEPRRAPVFGYIRLRLDGVGSADSEIPIALATMRRQVKRLKGESRASRARLSLGGRSAS
jgi:hypothetical protein